jgi:Zn-dependent peptidase ImmA (M78 family)
MELVHRRRISRRLQWASDLLSYVEEFIEIPPLNIVRVDFDPDGDEDEQIECAAEELRDLWALGDGPIRDLAGTMEENGIVLVREPVGCSDMDGVSSWVAGRPYVLLSAEVESGPRDLFNLAHELGHLILHAGVEVSSDNLGRIERQANRFAGAFLLPRSSFGSEVYSSSLEHFLTLKKRWGVAIAAMIYRSKDLRIVSENQYKYLMKQMNYQRIRRVEPLAYSGKLLKC